MARISPLPHRISGKGGCTANSGKGLYKFTFNSGGTATPAIGDVITGATTSTTAIIMNIDHTSGTWAGGDEVGILYISKPVGAGFDGTENINVVAQANILTMTSATSKDCLSIGDVFKFTFNSGGTTTPVIGNTIIGSTTAATSVIVGITLTSGTWAGGDALGTIYHTKITSQGAANTWNGNSYSNGENITIGADTNVMTTTSLSSRDLVGINSATAAKGVSTTNYQFGLEKTNDPTSSTKTSTLTVSNRTVTLNTASATTISTASLTTGWVASNSAVVATDTSGPTKYTNTCLRIAMPATAAVNTLYATFTLGADLNLSAYSNICFWSRNGNHSNSRWVIKLLDSADNVLVTFPEFFAHWGYNKAITLTHTTTLPTNVRKLALYSGSIKADSPAQVYLNDIYATNDFTLNALIGKTGAEFYPIKIVNGVDIVIDNDPISTYNAGRGYAEATQAAQTIYTRTDMIDNTTDESTTTQIMVPSVAGTNGSLIYYQGGINPETLEQDGWTWFNGQHGNGYAITNNVAFNKFNRIGLHRYYRGFHFNYSNFTYLQDAAVTACANFGVSHDGAYKVFFDGNVYIFSGGSNGLNGLIFEEQLAGQITSNSNNNSGFNFTSYGKKIFNSALTAKNNTNYGVYSDSNFLKINNLTTAVNGQGSTSIFRDCWFNNPLLSETTEFVWGWDSYTGMIYSSNHDNTTADKQETKNFSALKQTTVKPADASFAWKLSPTSVDYRSDWPGSIKIGRFYATSGTLVTCKARGCITNAAINGRLRVYPPDCGLTASVYSNTCTTVSTTFGTSEDLTLTFTPTTSGWFELWAEAYYPNTSSTHTYSFYVAHPVAVGSSIPLFTQA